MTLDNVCLGVEELALIMNLIGQPELAKSTMTSQLGFMNQEIAHARLTAAGHSLMARGWLTMDADGNMHLSDELAQIVGILIHADFSVRYSQSFLDAELVLTFHFDKSKIFEHQIKFGVLHSIREIENKASVVKQGVMFFELSKAMPFVCPPVNIPKALLDQVEKETNSSVIQKKLERNGLDKQTSEILAQDLINTKYRGTILRIEYGDDGVPRSDRGILILRGQTRLWLLRPQQQNDRALATLLAGTKQVFEKEVLDLLA